MINIKIPATSANIGSGFDSLGLALGLYNYVFIDEHDGIAISAMDNSDIPAGEDNLVFSTAKHLYDVCGRKFSGLKIHQQNNIPMTRGLGSSSACIVAGLVGANQLLGCPLAMGDIVDMAAMLEGHPDNSTPALLGGLVTAVIDAGKVYYVKQELSSQLKFAAIIPDFELKTSYSRSLLPKALPHSDAVYNLSRSALMSVSLYSGNFQNLRVAALDKVHQPYRLGLIEHSEEIFAAAYDFGAYSTYLSGGGPTLISILDSRIADFESKMRGFLNSIGLAGWGIQILDVDNSGTVIF